MRLAFLSDAHADGPGDAVQARLVELLGRIEADRLFLLGDVFHRGWAFPGPEGAFFPQHRPVVEALEALHRRGVGVSFLGGNHDFAMGWALRASGIEILVAGRLDLDGRLFHLAHGDEVEPSLSYALAHGLLRGRPFAALVDALGPDRAWRALGLLAGPAHRVRRTGARLREAQARYAAARLAEGARYVILGHSHEARVWEEAGGVFFNLGAFDESLRWLEIEGDAWRWREPGGP